MAGDEIVKGLQLRAALLHARLVVEAVLSGRDHGSIGWDAAEDEIFHQRQQVVPLLVRRHA